MDVHYRRILAGWQEYYIELLESKNEQKDKPSSNMKKNSEQRKSLKKQREKRLKGKNSK